MNLPHSRVLVTVSYTLVFFLCRVKAMKYKTRRIVMLQQTYPGIYLRGNGTRRQAETGKTKCTEPGTFLLCNVSERVSGTLDALYVLFL